MSGPAAPAARGLGGWAIPRAALARGALVSVVLLGPALAAALVLGPGVAVGFILGLAVGVPTGLMCGVALAAPLIALNGAALLAGGLATGSPTMAAILTGLTGLAVGPANRRGLGRTLSLAPVLVTVAASGSLGDEPLANALGLALGAAWAYALIQRTSARQAPVPLAPGVAWTHAVVLAATCAAAALVAMSVPLPHGYWIVVTLASVIQPLAHETARSNRERVVGTLVGSLLAVGLGVVVPSWLLAATLLALMALFVAYALVGDGVRRVAFQTVLIVLVLAGTSGGLGLDVAVQRLTWTIVGAGLVVVAGLTVDWLGRLADAANGPATFGSPAS